MNEYQLIVVGGGPGGYPLAFRMASKGWKVALIEEDNLGGTCLNWGCIPTKALLASAKGFHFLKNPGFLGLSNQSPQFSWEKIVQRKNDVVVKLREGVKKQLAGQNIEIIDGSARLFKNNIIKVSGKTDWEGKGARICLAVGSKPTFPPSLQDFLPKNETVFWSSDEAIHSTSVPESLLIIGGGVIGLELGQVYAEFGTKVTIVEMMSQILPGLDSAVAKRLMPVFKKAGLEIITGQKVENLTVVENTAQAEIASQKRSFQKVLWATGRKPNLSILKDTGVELTLKGNFLAVNETYETSLPGVYAVGDCIPGPMLAHRASYDAFILASQWMGKSVYPDYSVVPSCVYTYPEIAWVGLSEDQAKTQGIPFKIGRSLFSANGKALASGEFDGQVKTIVGEDGKLLGANLWGPEVSNLIIEATMVQKCGIDVFGISHIIHPHPTLSEVFLEGFASSFNEGGHG